MSTNSRSLRAMGRKGAILGVALSMAATTLGWRLRRRRSRRPSVTPATRASPPAVAHDLMPVNPLPAGGLPDIAPADLAPAAGRASPAVGMDEPWASPPAHRRVPRLLWLATYAVAISAPLLLVLAPDRAEPRTFMMELGSALGIAALALLAVQLAVPARLPLLASIGAEVAVRLHRRMADILLALVLAHVAAVMVADPARLELLRFFGAPWRAQAAIGSVVALAVLFATSFLRRRIHLQYARWRGVHLVLGALALVLAVAHTVGVGRYLVHGPAAWSLVALTAAGLGALVVMRSHWLRRPTVRPYRVARVRPERGGAVTLELLADGHPGRPFLPGQFAWLKLPGLRNLLAEHPFSYSSSADDPEHPQFTMQPRSGFTAQAATFEPGTRLLVDGPHGAYRPRDDASGTVLVAGGIGVTPSMSILRTAADRGDSRPFVLVYGARSLDTAPFLDELRALEARLRLTTVIVLSAPDPGWSGERGRINAGVLDRHLPHDLRGWQFMTCGAGPFVDAVLDAFEAVGVPGERVHAERFVEV